MPRLAPSRDRAQVCAELVAVVADKSRPDLLRDLVDCEEAELATIAHICGQRRARNATANHAHYTPLHRRIIDDVQLSLHD